MQCSGSLSILSISGIKLVPRTSFGNLAKSTFTAFTTDDGFKFSLTLIGLYHFAKRNEMRRKVEKQVLHY